MRPLVDKLAGRSDCFSVFNLVVQEVRVTHGTIAGVEQDLQCHLEVVVQNVQLAVGDDTLHDLVDHMRFGFQLLTFQAFNFRLRFEHQLLLDLTTGIQLVLDL
ncbi:hypothetical protein D3C76_1463940 [compost metagenome]